jgi:hypothetical protein
MKELLELIQATNVTLTVCAGIKGIRIDVRRVHTLVHSKSLVFTKEILGTPVMESIVLDKIKTTIKEVANG